MKVAFVSNYINHHQIPLSDALYAKLGENYRFIQTEPMEEERINMGWETREDIPYLYCYYDAKKECRDWIEECDIVIFGGTDEESYIRNRLQNGKIVIRYSERIYKEGQWKAISPRGLIRKYQDHVRYRKDLVYLLCAGAYVASDFHLIGAYPNKMLQWGYFPQFIEYEPQELFGKKPQNTIQIMWAGRFIDWKHPEDMVALAEALSKEKKEVLIHFVGDGELRESIVQEIEKKGLSNLFKLWGYQKPDKVRELMEQSSIYVFTSDYKEGWGAVLNEAMNSGCACVANCAIGAAPYLIKHGENGFLYPNGQRDVMIRQVKQLIEDKALREKMGANAYRTIKEQWNAQTAADHLYAFMEGLLNGKENLPKSGPVAKAKVIPVRKMYGECVKS